MAEHENITKAQNRPFFQGEDKTLTFTATSATNITGWTITFVLKKRLGDSALITKTVGSGITITDATNGIFTVALLKADTNVGTITPGKYYYEVFRSTSGSETVLAYGEVDILPRSGL